MDSITLKPNAGGFTLLEMALVCVVFSLLVGGLLAPLQNSREQLNNRRAAIQLEETRAALLGYAAHHGHLPCPASATSQGVGLRTHEGCVQYSGFLPLVDLGVTGAIDTAGLLLDPWSSPIRYSVSGRDGDLDGQADFVSAGGMRRAGFEHLAGDLQIEHWPGGTCDELQLRASRVVAVLYSDAENTYNSRAEEMNRAGGRRFASGAFSQSPNCGFDDQLVWLSDSTLFSALLKARQLP